MLARLDLGDGPADTLNGLCVECAREFEMSGVAISLIIAGDHRGVVGASGPEATAVEELQATSVEGPSMDAHLLGCAVLEPDLISATRWSVFAPAAVAAGVRAVFAFPLQIGAARFGALGAYRTRPGRLSDRDVADVSSVSILATTLVLMTQAGAPRGSFPNAVDRLGERGSVHQAAGMVAIQLGIGIADAAVALRARAYATDRPVSEVAADVVSRRIRFEP